jgi:phosphonate transport system permease protein
MQLFQYIWRMFPPRWDILPALLDPLVETLAMSIIGTSLAFITALLLSFPANRELSSNTAVYLSARAVLAVMRATPVLVLGIICVAAIGLGPSAGVLGIWFHTTGVLGKYISEALEAADSSIFDASLIDGCSKWQSYVKVMIPSEMNAVMSYLIYYYESNFRSATFLGVVGAGGIGLYLTAAVGLYNYGSVGMIVLVIISTALAIDMASRFVRSKFL